MKKLLILLAVAFSLNTNAQQNTAFTSTDGTSNFAWWSFANLATAMNAVVTTSSYNDPAWLTGVSWSKISGAPAFIAVSTVSNSVSRSLNSSFRPSTTLASMVSYSVQIAATISLTAGQNGTV